MGDLIGFISLYIEDFFSPFKIKKQNVLLHKQDNTTTSQFYKKYILKKYGTKIADFNGISRGKIFFTIPSQTKEKEEGK